MSDTHDSVINDLDAWRDNLDILIHHLAAADEDASREAVFILLLQELGLFGGPEGPMLHLFPVLDVIKCRIEKSDLDGAMRQALSFQKQLEEVAALVRGGTSHAGQGIPASPTIPPDTEDAP
jgi:hypothetical protein